MFTREVRNPGTALTTATRSKHAFNAAGDTVTYAYRCINICSLKHAVHGEASRSTGLHSLSPGRSSSRLMKTTFLAFPLSENSFTLDSPNTRAPIRAALKSRSHKAVRRCCATRRWPRTVCVRTAPRRLRRFRMPSPTRNLAS